jgi:phytoene/squalene synthetase
MHKDDKKLFRSYTGTVTQMVGRLRALSEQYDKGNIPLARELRHIAEDLEYVTVDIEDTVERV